MRESKINFSAPNLMSICVDGRSDSDIAGRLYHRGSPEPVRFDTGGRMILEMERWCDSVGYPQPEVVSREFRTDSRSGAPDKRQGVRFKGAGEAERNIEMDGGALLDKKGEEGTFVVHIKYRQNATWQGQVTWSEKKKTCSFRSALELLKLIDCALDGEEE